MMKRYGYALLFILTLINLYFCAYSVLHGELNFFNDVARDFLLFREIDAKKIMLIGPRSNTGGLFHGPLWSYLNYPAYLVGHGNPVIVAWFWLLLVVISLIFGFWAVKKLFGTLSAWAWCLLFSANLIPYTNGVFHSLAPVFIVLPLFYTLVQYLKKKKIRYCVLHLSLAAMIFQFNVGVGIPIFLLSLMLLLIFMLKNKLWVHLLAFFLIPLFLGNFIIFELRHQFLMSKAALAFWQFQRYWHPMPFQNWILNRFTEGVNLRLTLLYYLPLLAVVFLIMLVSSILMIKKSTKYRPFYLLFLYYYLGYMLLTFSNKGVILGHFVFFLMPLNVLWFVSFLKEKKYRKVFLAILAALTIINFQQADVYIRNLQNSFFDKNPESWRALSSVAQTVISRQDKTPFGYFVFSPDAFAYQPRYAMIYHFQASGAAAFEYVKKATTYIIAQPPPLSDPYITHVWWRKNRVKISAEPVWTKQFPSGYAIEEFHLSEAEQKIPHEKTIELGIHFR